MPATRQVEVAAKCLALSMGPYLCGGVRISPGGSAMCVENVLPALKAGAHVVFLEELISYVRNYKDAPAGWLAEFGDRLRKLLAGTDDEEDD